MQTTLSLPIIVITMQIIYWGCYSWLPSIMRDFMRDFPSDSWKDTSENDIASLTVMLVNVGAIFGTLVWIWAADAVGRKAPSCTSVLVSWCSSLRS